MKNKIFIYCIMFLFSSIIAKAQTPLYSSVLVSDQGSNNSLGSANTSRNLAVDAQGNIGVVYLGSSGLRFAKSITRGQSFLPSVQLSSATSGSAEVEVADNGNIYVIYSNGSQISLFVSLNGGTTFSGPNIIGNGQIPHIASYGNNVYVVPRTGSPVYRNSNNGIGAFSSVTVGSWVYADIRVDKANGDVYLIADNPTLFMFRSVNSGASFSSVPISGSVFYSSYSITTGPLGKFIYVAGSASAGYRVNFTNGASTSIPVGNNVVTEGRTLASDEFGNFIDGYAQATNTMAFRVSNNLGNSFQNAITIANSTTHNIARNSSTQDIDVVYRGTDGNIYLNVYNNLLLGLTVSGVNQSYCPESTGVINYSITGANINSSNEFVAQLSDNNRSFANPIIIGSIMSTASTGTINITIPSNIPSGSNYRIRVVSTNPATKGADNGFDIAINPVPTASIIASGSTTFCAGSSVVLTANLSSAGSTYLWSNGETTRSITALTGGNYTVQVTNLCGLSAVSTPIVITSTPAPIAVISASGLTNLCPGSSVSLTSSEGISYLWSNGSTARTINVSTQGVYIVTVRGLGGCSTNSSPVTVNVNNSFCNQAPVAVAKSITISAGADCSGSALATDFDGGSTDADGDILTYSVSPAGPYAIGVTAVVLTVTDPKGASSSSSATVTVKDTTFPTVLTQNRTIQLNSAGNATITAADINNGSSDNCGIFTIALSKTSFDCSNVRPNTVTLTVTDVNGNVSTATATVTVQDNIFPTAITRNISVDLVNGSANITAAQINNGSFDNCSIAPPVLDRTTFDCSSIGANTVTLTVTDASGNVSTATAVVTVVGELTTSLIASVPTSTVFTGGVATNLYLGYGAQSTTLQVSNSAIGGTDPRSYTYVWTGTGLTGTNSGSPVFTPTSAGLYNFKVVVTNKYGCESIAYISICVKDIREKDRNGRFTGKVFICHAPPGNVGNSNTLSISVNAVPSHLSQHSFDRLGTCGDAPCTSSPAVAPNSVGGSGNSSENNVSTIDLNVNSTEFIAYPNPFGKQTTVRFTLPYQEDKATLDIYDLRGVKIQSLFNGNANAQTTYEVQFNGQNLSAGTYFFRLITAKEVKNFKVIMSE